MAGTKVTRPARRSSKGGRDDLSDSARSTVDSEVIPSARSPAGEMDAAAREACVDAVPAQSKGAGDLVSGPSLPIGVS